jgi:glycosyltransferase involved in cell wall biosynthesis
MKENSNSTRVGYPIVMFGTDSSVFDPKSDSALRMKTYEEFHSKIYIVTSAFDKEGRDVVKLSEKTSVYSSKGGNKVKILWGMYRQARNLMREYGVRCVMSQDPFMLGFIAHLLTRGGKGVFSVGIYGTDTSNVFFCRESLKHRFYALVARFILPRATAIQTDGPETVARLRDAYGDKVFFKPMIPANIDVLGARNPMPSEGSLKILFMGRFVVQKNIPLLVDVIEQTNKEMLGKVHFTAVGTGPEHDWFKGEIGTRGLLGACSILGSVSREEVADLIMGHDALLIVSYYEGFPRVFMEAAVAGMPVITTNVGGIKDLIVDGESGFVLQQGASAKEITERIKRLAEDRALLASFSVAIRKRWQEMYGGTTVLDYQRPLVEFLGSCLGVLPNGVQG